jgi:hypothetical protein
MTFCMAMVVARSRSADSFSRFKTAPIAGACSTKGLRISTCHDPPQLSTHNFTFGLAEPQFCFQEIVQRHSNCSTLRETGRTERSRRAPANRPPAGNIPNRTSTLNEKLRPTLAVRLNNNGEWRFARSCQDFVILRQEELGGWSKKSRGDSRSGRSNLRTHFYTDLDKTHAHRHLIAGDPGTTAANPVEAAANTQHRPIGQ